mmetsp:Transcript_99736/g.253583  ORF Transcript_99736/g.253583 Transcript_99736/m.253583 type:complete len:235 (-) Transcript_99736:87-791(-)
MACGDMAGRALDVGPGAERKPGDSVPCKERGGTCAGEAGGLATLPGAPPTPRQWGAASGLRARAWAMPAKVGCEASVETSTGDRGVADACLVPTAPAIAAAAPPARLWCCGKVVAELDVTKVLFIPATGEFTRKLVAGNTALLSRDGVRVVDDDEGAVWALALTATALGVMCPFAPTPLWSVCEVSLTNRIDNLWAWPWPCNASWARRNKFASAASLKSNARFEMLSSTRWVTL